MRQQILRRIKPISLALVTRHAGLNTQNGTRFRALENSTVVKAGLDSEPSQKPLRTRSKASILNEGALLGPLTEKGEVVSLYSWCAAVLGNAAIKIFFGGILLEVEPHCLKYQQG